MEFAFFKGCKIPYFVPQYEVSTRAVCNALGIKLIDVEFNCCGYPVSHLDRSSFLLSAARNLARAAQKGLDILTPCKCCYGTLKKAARLINENTSLREEIKDWLGQESLAYEDGVEVKHILSVLYDDMGVDKIRDRVTRPFSGLNIATHYGCHALRPASLTGFDDPVNPVKFDRLVEVTGAKSVPWGLKLQCCGNPLWEKNKSLSVNLTIKKLENAKKAQAHYLCVSCTYCQIQFDTVQHHIVQEDKVSPLPCILFPQLLGLSLGLNPLELRIDENQISIQRVIEYFSS